MDDLKRRFKIVEEQANKNLDEINNKYPHLKSLSYNAIYKLHKEDISDKVKLIRARAIIDQINSIISKYTACGKGCSHCCNIATVVYEVEAENIGRAIKKPPLKVNRNLISDGTEKLKEYQEATQGIPCPFLKNNECSIYNNRPLACRYHHNLSFSSEMCDPAIMPEQTCIPRINMPKFEVMLVRIFGGDGKMGDIRDYFPTGAD